MNKVLYLIPTMAFALDRILKYLVLQQGSFVINKGVVFGIGIISSNYIILLIILVIVLLLVYSLKNQNYRLFVMFLVLGGISNLIDRFLYNGVVDFIKLPYVPMFNVADILIVSGILLIFLYEINGFKKIES